MTIPGAELAAGAAAAGAWAEAYCPTNAVEAIRIRVLVWMVFMRQSSRIQGVSFSRSFSKTANPFVSRHGVMLALSEVATGSGAGMSCRRSG